MDRDASTDLYKAELRARVVSADEQDLFGLVEVGGVTLVVNPALEVARASAVPAPARDEDKLEAVVVERSGLSVKG